MQAEVSIHLPSGSRTSIKLTPGRFAIEGISTGHPKLAGSGGMSDADLDCVWNPETTGLLWRDPSASGSRYALLEPNHALQQKGFTLEFHLTIDPPKLDGQTFERHDLDATHRYLIGRSPEPTDQDRNARLITLDSMVKTVSKTHAVLYCEDGTWWIADRSSTQTLHNGNAIHQALLVFGDRFKIGPYVFEFRGTSIDRVDHIDTGRIAANNLSVIVRDRVTGNPLPILNDVSINIETGRFIGILGGSGQGKSTLLNALCGIRPADNGSVTIGGIDIGLLNKLRPGLVGFVPQDDIVHTELVVRDAFLLAAKLRVRLAPKQRETLVDNTIRHLGLQEHAGKRVVHLSGGQRKRVSIGIELLSKPAVLFLDEPSSGLDPTTEESLMELLQSLTKTNLTVVCTTHVLQKAYLFHRLIFIHGGRLIFEGNSAVAREFFLHQGGSATDSVSSSRGSVEVIKTPLEKIYTQVLRGDRTALEWESQFKEWAAKNALGIRAPESESVPATDDKRVSAFSRFTTLLVRQRKILAADWLNLAFLFCQVVLIGILIALVSDEFGFRMFLGLIATMWFGCSNGAQQIVSEVPILKREQVCGLGRNVYLGSKFVFQSAISCVQGLLLFLIIIPLGHFFHPVDFDEETFKARYQLRVDGAIARKVPIVEHEDLEDFSVVSDDSDSQEVRSSTPKKETAAKAEEKSTGLVSQFLQAPPLWMAATVAKWFVMEDNLTESGDRPMTDEQGNAMSGADGKPLRYPATSLWKVLSTGVLLKMFSYIGAALVGVSLGLAVSAWVRTPTQAVMWVPLLLIPQILFGGYVVTLPEMSNLIRTVSIGFPSRACQRIIDVSNLYGRGMPFMTNLTKTPLFLTGSAEPEQVEWKEGDQVVSESFDRESYVNISWQNLVVIPSKLGQHKIARELVGVDSYGTEMRAKKDTVERRRDVTYGKGTPYLFTFPAVISSWILLGWIGFCYLAALLGIRTKTQS